MQLQVAVKLTRFAAIVAAYISSCSAAQVDALLGPLVDVGIGGGRSASDEARQASHGDATARTVATT